MRPLVQKTVHTLMPPDEALLGEARASVPSRGGHAGFLERIEAFRRVEQQSPRAPAGWPGTLRVAAFNAERLKDRAAVRGLMGRAGAHMNLFCEVDAGMARSGNVHTVRDLIGSSGEGYVFGVEFVELDLGDGEEMRAHAHERNLWGYHGNAIVSGLALEDPCLIPLEESGRWFSGFKGAQRRIGGRMAVAARLADAPRPLWVVSAHLESKTDPADRRAQVQNLLRVLDHLAPGEACVIGGDFNTKALPREGEARQRLLSRPEEDEPLFADLREAGFTWTDANSDEPTQRPGPKNKHKPPFGKLDWLFVRGITASRPRVMPALDAQGRPVSDHDMITVDLSF